MKQISKACMVYMYNTLYIHIYTLYNMAQAKTIVSKAKYQDDDGKLE